MNLFWGFLAALLIAGLAYRAKSLSVSGAIGALVLGTVIFGFGGLGWAVLLMGFFVSSSLLSRMFRRRKSELSEKFSKGSQRDIGQVLANGGVAGGLALVHALIPGAGWVWLAFAASLAAVNSDTWATELGVLSRKLPRLVTTLLPVPRGTSGGVTVVGTLAALGGGLLIALLAALFPHEAGSAPGVGVVAAQIALITVAALAGSFVDSLLGATVQALYHCPSCQSETERHPIHTCGTGTVHSRGWRWLNNDWVNALCALSAACAVGLLTWLMPGWFGI